MTVFNRSPDRTMGATERIEWHRGHHTVFELFSWKLGDDGAAKEKTMTNEVPAGTPRTTRAHFIGRLIAAEISSARPHRREKSPSLLSRLPVRFHLGKFSEKRDIGFVWSVLFGSLQRRFKKNAHH